MHYHKLTKFSLSLFISALALLGLSQSAQAKSIQNQNLVNNSLRITATVPKMHRIISFPDRFKGGRFPQSINVSNNQHYVYLGFDSYINDGCKLMRFNLQNHHFKVGKTFLGGHAQGVSLNGNHLWFQNQGSNYKGDDHAGLSNYGSFVEVSTSHLRPIYRHAYRLRHGNEFNNSLAFCGQYGALIAVRIQRNHGIFKKHETVFYNIPNLNEHNFKWQRLNTVLRHTPNTAITECLAYNPANQHLYIEYETPSIIMSLPIVKLMNNTLTRKDIKVARLFPNREPEGITFTQDGQAYLQFAEKHPSMIATIYKTNQPFNF